MNYKFECMKVV